MTIDMKKFIEVRKTPYSEIQDIEVKDDYVEFTEKYDLNHPMCPIIRIEMKDARLTSFSEVKRLPKFHFELMFGGVD